MIQTWLDTVAETTLLALGERLEAVWLEPGALLFERGDPGDSMYLVVDGELEVVIADPAGGEWLIDRVPPGEILGEMALLTGQPRSATVRAGTATELHRLSKSDFEALSAQDPDLLKGLNDYVAPRAQRVSLVETLASLFGPLSLERLHALQARCTMRALDAGEAVLLDADSAFVVARGRAQLTMLLDNGRVRACGVLGAGDAVGQFCLVSGETGPVRLVAEEACRLLGVR